MTDILVIGGGTAGMTAAIYAARAGRSATIVEAGVYGGQITTSPGVENYPGFSAISGSEFAEKLTEQVTRLDVGTEFGKVTELKKENGIFRATTEDGDTFEGRAVILATGAKHRKLGLAREEELTGKGVSYCAVCDGSFFKGREVAVVGGGSSALQQALYLSALAKHVTLVHRRDEFRGEERMVKSLKKVANVTLETNAVARELIGAAQLEGIVLEDVLTKKTRRLPVDGLFVAIGQEPDNGVFKELVDLDSSGFIVAGEDCRTSCPGIFAAGDCRTKAVRQLTTATGDGTIAATEAVDYLETIED